MGFVTMPMIFQQIPLGHFFGTLWFGLLFLAGVTSSISLAQPAITFLEDEFDIPQAKATKIFGAITFVLCHFPMLFLANGVLDEMDFWGGTIALVVFATLEAIMFSWVFGLDKGWSEMHHGSELQVPKFYRWILKYITPVFLIGLLIWWLFVKAPPIIMMEGVPEENKWTVLGTRLGLLGLGTLLILLVRAAWRRREAMGRMPDYHSTT